MSTISNARPPLAGDLSGDERQAVIDGTSGLAPELAELVRTMIEDWGDLTSDEHIAGLAIIAEALVHLPGSVDGAVRPPSPGRCGIVCPMTATGDPTYEELATWAEKRLVRSHTTDGRFDSEKCTCGACRFAQAAADHFRRLTSET